MSSLRRSIPSVQESTRDVNDSPSRRGFQLKKEPPKRPNYFLSLRLGDERSRFKPVLDHIRTTLPTYTKTLQTLEQLHLTLLVFHAEKADDILPPFRQCVKSVFPSTLEEPIEISMKGIGTFGRGRVMFAQPAMTETLMNLYEEVLPIFQACDSIASIPDRPYSPHLTLAKVNQQFARQGKWAKKLPSSAWEPFEDNDWGTFSLDSIEISSMMDPKDEDGYYKCVDKYTISKPLTH